MSTQLISIIVLLISVIIHEVAHAVVANYLGDPTAKNEGRITLNPLPHLDIVGSFLLPGLLLVTGASFFIGWAKPVPVNPKFFKRPIRDMMWVALAGPVSNLILMFLCLYFFNLFLRFPQLDGGVIYQVMIFLLVSIQLNFILAIFNLLPIPPLDGSRILVYFLPKSAQEWVYKLEPYGFALLFLLVYLGVIGDILQVFGGTILRFLLN